MVPAKFVFFCLWLTLSCFSAVKCEIDENNYNVITSMINSPIRSIKGIHDKLAVGKFVPKMIFF